MIRRTLCFVPCLLAALATPGLAACPQNHFAFSDAAFFSSLPVDNRSGFGGSGSYNVPNGTLNVFAGCSSQPECGSSADVYIEDDFTLTGLPAGTGVPLLAHMNVSLAFVQGGGFGLGSATLKDALGNSVSANGPKSGYDMALAVAAVAGQPFRLHFEGNASGSGASGYSLSTFSFTGLPPGTVLTSCQGYTTAGAVPALATSWGKVKTLYR